MVVGVAEAGLGEQAWLDMGTHEVEITVDLQSCNKEVEVHLYRLAHQEL